MTAKRYFAPAEQIQFPFITLKGREHHHLTRVMRIQRGETIEVFDGRGNYHSARVERIDSSITKLRIVKSYFENKARFKLILAPALIKPKSMDLMLQKSTEMGASCISPVLAERSVVKLERNIQKKITRWEKIVLSAAKQCGRAYLPKIEKPVPLARFLKEKAGGTGLCLYQHEQYLLKDILEESSPSPEKVFLLVGPEGDWTDPEKKNIVQHGFRMASLGPKTLRSETAAICGLAIISHFWMI